MAHLMYLLDSAGLDTTEKIERAVKEWPLNKWQEIRGQLWQILSSGRESVTQPGNEFDPFDFVASASMRGEVGCMNWDCRSEKARALARYGTLYARKILIPIRLGVTPAHGGMTDNMRYALAGTLMSVLEYRPLIECGVATVTAGALSYCSEHLAQAVPNHPKIEHVATSLFTREFDKFSLSFERRSDLNVLHLKGPVDYLPHGQLHRFLDHSPQWLPRSVVRSGNVRSTRLSPSTVKKSRVVEGIFRSIAQDVTIQQYYTVTNNATYLTDMRGEAHVLDLLSGREENRARNALFAKNLLHSVPLLSDVPIETVLKVRKEEPDAFIRYRAAIACIIREYGSHKDELRPKDAKEIFADIVEPELARLRMQTNVIRRAGVKKVVAKAVASSVAVGVGIYGGLLPSDFASLLKVAGGIGLLSQIGESVGLIERNPAEIKNHNLYFLLKIQDRAVKSHQRPLG